MPVDRSEIGPRRDSFVRYPNFTYSTIQEGLARVMASRKVGRNGWSVMVALCRKVYEDGRFGRMSAEDIRKASGLDLKQVARGMEELRNKGIIVPVVRKTKEGYRHPDRSSFGHVATYCFTRPVWELIEKAPPPEDAHG